MLISVENQPSCFNHLPKHYNWYGLYYKKELYGYIGLEVVGNVASFHTNIKKWTIETSKELHKDWDRLKSLCRKRNVKIAIASNANTNDKKWVKFIKMFGFPEPELVWISQQEI